MLKVGRQVLPALARFVIPRSYMSVMKHQRALLKSFGSSSDELQCADSLTANSSEIVNTQKRVSLVTCCFVCKSLQFDVHVMSVLSYKPAK